MINLDFIFCLLEKCFFFGVEEEMRKIISEEEEIYIREGRLVLF
jgi:hypothetical protein